MISDSSNAKRIIGLFLRIRALKTRIKLFQGYSIPFDEESKLLFGVQAPTYDSTYFENILNQIDALVPGEGNLSERVNDFRHQFIVPPELLPEVFKAAINDSDLKLKEIEEVWKEHK